MPTPLPWITDRLPLEDDGDEYGDVVVLLDGSTDWALIPWCQVDAEMPWLAFTSLSSAKFIAASTAEPTFEPLNQPRRFVSINRIVLGDGAHIIDAIADDGTAWWIASGRSEWAPILPPLPPHYAPPRETHETHPPQLT